MSCILARDVMHPRLSLPAKAKGADVVRKLLSEYPALPVVNEKDEVIGIVSEYDVFSAVQQGRTVNEFSAESIMSCGHDEHTGACDKPVTVFPDTRIEEVVDLMFNRNFTVVPVVENKKLVGIISRKNVINAIAEEGFWPEEHFQKRVPK
ncbi:MAG: CBS domain-containing protein [Nitrospirota bacterium]